MRQNACIILDSWEVNRYYFRSMFVRHGVRLYCYVHTYMYRLFCLVQGCIAESCVYLQVLWLALTDRET